jgi:hypothetical protein
MGKRRVRRAAALFSAVLAAGTASAATGRTVTPAPAHGSTPSVTTLTPADGGTPVADLTYTGTNGSVYVRDVFASGQPDISLGGHLIGGPAIAGQPGSLMVFGRGTDNALWWDRQTSRGWTGWRSLGGRLTSKPGVTTDAAGVPIVLVRGANGAVWFRQAGNGGRWSGWVSLGGDLLSGTAPAAVRDSGGSLMLAVVGANRHIYLYAHTSAGYGFHDLGGRTTSDPAITFVSGTTQAPNTHLAVVFVRGTDGALYAQQVTDPVTTFNGVWRSLGGRLTSGIAAQTAAGGSYTYVFALGTDNQFWMRTGGWPSLGSWTRA